MIGTGGSLQVTIEALLKKGVIEENITIIAVIGCKDGVKKILDKYQKVKMVLGYLDPLLLKDSKYIAPGLGDFGDRYFGAP
jgi:uracil phosphoribosyltransferase